jgi:uncharacterized membrane protein
VTSGRLGYLDWGRGLCVVLMIATHGLYGWVRPEDHGDRVYRTMVLIGGFPGAVFLFISGMVLALAAESMHRRGESPRAVFRAGLRRGLEILGYAFAFRLWMFASGRFRTPIDLLRVDILNCIGVALLLAGVVALPWPRRGVRLCVALALAAGVAAVAPLTWDSALADALPYGLAGYIDGRHPGSFFPPIPWAGFAALGTAAGIVLAAWRAKGWEPRLFAALGILGAAAIPLALWADRALPAVYARYDFWHTSPAYFAVKAGVVLLTMASAFLFDKLPAQGWIRQLGRTSLLVYWVHLEIIYGEHVASAARGRLPLPEAVAAVFALTLAMVALSYARDGRLRLGATTFPPARDRRPA